MRGRGYDKAVWGLASVEKNCRYPVIGKTDRHCTWKIGDEGVTISSASWGPALAEAGGGHIAPEILEMCKSCIFAFNAVFRITVRPSLCCTIPFALLSPSVGIVLLASGNIHNSISTYTKLHWERISGFLGRSEG